MDLVRDTAILAQRQFRLTVGSRVGLVIGLLQPVLFLVLFGPLMNNVLTGADLHGGTAWQLYVPGMLVMLGLFSAGFAGFAVFADLHSGFQERLRVTRVSREALLFGRIAHDVVVQTLQATLILVVSVMFWLRVSIGGLLIGMLFVVLITVACASLSYTLALRLKTEYAYAPFISGVTLPIMLLSGILLPMDLAPRWLQVVSYANPFRHIVDGMRFAFRSDFGAPRLYAGLGVALALAVLSLVLGARSFWKEQA